MSKQEKLLRKLLNGQFKNVKFSELKQLLLAFGFTLERVNGSHHIFVHKDISEIVNIQNVKGEAKPYQIKQIMQLIEKHDLKMED